MSTAVSGMAIDKSLWSTPVFMTGPEWDREWSDNPDRMMAYTIYRTFRVEALLRRRYPSLYLNPAEFRSSARREAMRRELFYRHVTTCVDIWQTEDRDIPLTVAQTEHVLTEVRFWPAVQMSGWELGGVSEWLRSMYGIHTFRVHTHIARPLRYTKLQQWDMDDPEQDDYWYGLTSLEYNWDLDLQRQLDEAFWSMSDKGRADV